MLILHAPLLEFELCNDKDRSCLECPAHGLVKRCEGVIKGVKEWKSFFISWSQDCPDANDFFFYFFCSITCIILGSLAVVILGKQHI